MLPLGYCRPKTGHGRHPSGTLDSSDSFCSRTCPLAGLRLSCNYIAILAAFSPILLPSFLLSGRASQWEALVEDWRMVSGESTGSFSSSSLCFLWHLQQQPSVSPPCLHLPPDTIPAPSVVQFSPGCL